jgi:hypothetical protein
LDDVDPQLEREIFSLRQPHIADRKPQGPPAVDGTSVLRRARLACAFSAS